MLFIPSFQNQIMLYFRVMNLYCSVPNLARQLLYKILLKKLEQSLTVTLSGLEIIYKSSRDECHEVEIIYSIQNSSPPSAIQGTSTPTFIQIAISLCLKCRNEVFQNKVEIVTVCTRFYTFLHFLVVVLEGNNRSPARNSIKRYVSHVK